MSGDKNKLEDTDELEKKISEKISSIQNILTALSLLSKGMGTDEPPIRIFRAYVFSNILFNSIALELLIKIFYELEKGVSARISHNILSIFTKLKVNTRNMLEFEYQENLNKDIVRFKKEKPQETEMIDSMSRMTFRELLKCNVVTMRDFKYSGTLASNISFPDITFYQVIFKTIENNFGGKKWVKTSLKKDLK